MTVKSQEIIQGIVSQLEQSIIFGHLRPHEPLIEDALMLQFDAKRHIIRQAITALVDRGTVTKEAGRSARVRFYAAAEVEQIYQLRVGLFVLVVDLMPLPVDDSAMAALTLAHAEHQDAVARRDLLAIHEANDRFHFALYDASGNPYLVDAIRNVEWLSTPIRSYGIGDTDVMRNSVEEHARMIAAITKQDRPALRTLVVQHVEPGKQVYLRGLGGIERLHRVG